MSSGSDSQLLEDYQNNTQYRFTLDHTSIKNEQKQPCNTQKSHSNSNILEMTNQKEIQIEENNLEDNEDLENDFFENNLKIKEYTAHKIPPDELIKYLKTDFENGLTNKQVQNRLKLQGRNIITNNTSKYSTIIKFIEELWYDYLIDYVCCIGLLLFYPLNRKDAYNLYLAILVFSSTLISGFLIFFQKQKLHYLIQKISSQVKKVSVIREGHVVQIEEEELVEGDIIFVREGQIFPADIRVIEEYEDLGVIEYSLTGNLNTYNKTSKYIRNITYTYSQNVLFQECYCHYGKAKGIVIKTGNRTYKANKDRKYNYVQGKDYIINVRIASILPYIFAFIVAVLVFIISSFSTNLCELQRLSLSFSLVLSLSPIHLLLYLHDSQKKMIQNLKEKQNIIVNRIHSDLEYLDSEICIFLDIDTFTQNNWQVKNVWYGGREQSNYNINNKDFQTLLTCLIITNTANLVNHFEEEEEDNRNINYSISEGEGSNEDIGQLRFLQSILNVKDFKKRVQYAQENGKKPYLQKCQSNQNPYKYKYFNIYVIEEETQNSHYTIVMKGKIELLINFCTQIQIGNEAVDLDDIMLQQIRKDYNRYLKNCNIVIGVAKLYLPKKKFPRGHSFDLSQLKSFNLIFCGMISQEDLITDNIQQVYQNLKATNKRVILLGGRKSYGVLLKSGLLDGIVTNIQLENGGMSVKESINQCEGLIYFNTPKDLDFDLVFQKNICMINGFNSEFQYFYSRGIATVYVTRQLYFSKFLQPFDRLVFYGNIKEHKTKYNAHFFLNDNKLDQLIPLIEEGKKQGELVFQAYKLYWSSTYIKLLSFFTFVILDIPLPISGAYFYLIFLILDYFIPVLYESPEMQLNVSKPQLSEIEFTIIRYFLYTTFIGFMYISAGLIGYFTTLDYYGFPTNSLFGIKSLLAYKPPIGDFNNYINPQSNQQESYFNQHLYNLSFDCTTSQIFNYYKFKINWLNDSDSYFDLRKAFLKCNDNNKLWEPSINWSYCDVSSEENISPITNQSICYTTEALKYAQTSFFVSIMFFYCIQIIFSKNFKSFSFTKEINKKVILIILIKLLILIVFLYVPRVQKVFGTRPIQFQLFESPYFAFINLYIFLVQVRTYLMRNFRWLQKYL